MEVKYLNGKEVMDLFSSGERAGAYVKVGFLRTFLGCIYEEEEDALERKNKLPDSYWIGMDYTDYGMDLPTLYSCHGCDDQPDQVTIGISWDSIQGKLENDELWVWEA